MLDELIFVILAEVVWFMESWHDFSRILGISGPFWQNS